MGGGLAGDAFSKAGNVGVVGANLRRSGSVELVLGSSIRLPISPLESFQKQCDEDDDAMDEDDMGEQGSRSDSARASVATAPGAAPTEAKEAPRRRRPRESLEQEMARVLSDGAPHVAFQEEALLSKGLRGLAAPSWAEREEHDRNHIP